MARGRKIRIGNTVRTIPAAKENRFDEIDATLRQFYPGPDHSHEYAAAIAAAATYLIDAPEPPTPWVIRSASRGNSVSAEPVDAWTAQLDLILAPHAQRLAGARVGFVLAEPALLAQLAEKLGPWTVTGPARAVTAAALADVVGAVVGG